MPAGLSRQHFPPFGSTGRQHGATAHSGHTMTEPMTPFANKPAWLIGALHRRPLHFIPILPLYHKKEEKGKRRRKQEPRRRSSRPRLPLNQIRYLLHKRSINPAPFCNVSASLTEFTKKLAHFGIATVCSSQTISKASLIHLLHKILYLSENPYQEIQIPFIIKRNKL